MSLPVGGGAGEAFAELSRMRGEFYACLTARGDDLFELTDAMLCAQGAVRSVVELTLTPEHRRGHGALYDGLNDGRVDIPLLRKLLSSISLPRFSAHNSPAVIRVVMPPPSTCAGHTRSRTARDLCGPPRRIARSAMCQGFGRPIP
ncbi:transposase [Nocardia sp. NPDC059246]|uniref:transposase n=1 Tax=unclassified Nocardia TaxID=2637762 RepID=UPI00368D3815